MTNIDEIALRADVILGGYAFIKNQDDSFAVVNLNRPGHACVVSTNGEVIETSMDDIELSIALERLSTAENYME